MPNLHISIWVVHFRKWQPQKTPAVTNNMFQKTFLHDTKKTLIILSSWKRQIPINSKEVILNTVFVIRI